MHGTTQERARRSRRGVAALATAAALAVGAGGAAAAPPPAATADGGRLVVDEAFTQRVAAAVEGQVSTVIEVSDGGYLVGGYLSAPEGHDPIPGGIVRLRADGSLDTAFNAHLGTGAGWDAVTAMTETSDGGFVVAGRFWEFDGHELDCGIVRLHPDGSFDDSFAVDASGPCGQVHTVVEADDGDLLVGGFFSMPTDEEQWLSNVARLHADGSAATAYNASLGWGLTGGTVGAGVSALVEMPDGGVLVGGQFYSTDEDWERPGLARIAPGGGYDTEFHARLGSMSPGPWVNAVTLASDGTILVAGGNWWNGEYDPFVEGLARLQPDGTLDRTFRPLGGGDSVHAITELSDGRVLAAGWFDDGAEGRTLAVIHPDGTVDDALSADLSGALGGHASRMLATGDGGAVLAGDFWGSGRSLVRLVRAP